MSWKNRATTRSLRLNKTIETLHYEINLNHGWGCLVLECENIKEGKREFINKVTSQELLKQFPDLKEWEGLLYSFEKVVQLEKELRQTKEELFKIKKEVGLNEQE